MNIKKAITGWVLKSLDINQMMAFFRQENGGRLDIENKVHRPYAQVELVFTCITKLINSIAGLNLVISTIDDKVVESGPAIDLLFKNKEQSWQRTVREWIGHYALSRDVFIIYTDINNDGVASFQIVNGSQMRALTNNGAMSGTLIGWEYCGLYGERKRLDISQVHQTKNFNPHNKFHGQSPLGPSKNSIDYSHAAGVHNTAALNNSGEPGPIFTLDGNPDEPTIRAFLDNYENRHGGPANTNRPCALSGVKDVKTIAHTMADMQVAEISNMTDTKICIVLDTPPELVGLGKEAQYSYGPAQRAYAFYTVLPIAKLFADELTAGLLNQFYPSSIRAVEFAKSKMFSGVKFRPVNRTGYLDAKQKAVQSGQQLFAWFDIDQWPPIEEAKRESTKTILEFTASGIPLNNLIRTHDLPYDEVPWGNDWWISMGQVPARYALEAGLEGLTGTAPPAPEPPPAKSKELEAANEKADEARKLRIWQNWVISWAGIEREYTGAMRTFFVRQQRELLDKLAAAMPEKKTVEKADLKPDEIIARVVFDLKKEGDKIRAINHTFFDKASELGIRQAAAEAGIVGAELINEFTDTVKRTYALRQALLIQSQKITGVNITTQNMVAEQLREGLKAGEGLNDLTNRVKNVLGSNRSRAQDIARTQTGSAVSSGRHAGIKHTGLDLKFWLDAHDSHVRKSHQDAGRDYAKGIPIDEYFLVETPTGLKEALMYPGDPRGSAANIINCRCVELAGKAGESKAIILARYVTVKFYSYEDMQTKPA